MTTRPPKREDATITIPAGTLDDEPIDEATLDAIADCLEVLMRETGIGVELLGAPTAPPQSMRQPIHDKRANHPKQPRPQ